MGDGAETLTLYVPDDGRWYFVGMRVRVDRTVDPPDVRPDRRGDYEVDDCRRQTRRPGGDPVLRLDLRRIGA